MNGPLRWMVSLLVGTMIGGEAYGSVGDPATDDAALIVMVLALPSYAGCGDPMYDFDNNALTCDELVTFPPGGFMQLWVLASRRAPSVWTDGIGGVQFGWEHTDLAFSGGFTLCTGGAEIPQDGWPATSGTGTAVTWSGGCYVSPGANARIGFVSLFDSTLGEVQLTGDPRLADPDGSALYTTCTAEPFRIPSVNLQGSVLADGVDPACPTPPIPTRTVGWSRIKSLYQR